MIAEFALRSAPGRREVREDKCDELRLGELNGNRRRSWAFCHIAHRKWVDVKPERSSPESLTIAYNTKGYGTHKTRNHLIPNTLEIRAGYRFVVMVNKDMHLRPYVDHRTAGGTIPMNV